VPTVARDIPDPATGCAIGSMGPGSSAIGFQRDTDGYRLTAWGSDGTLHGSRLEGPMRRRELSAAAIAHFEEALDPPPADREVTQQDLRELVAWLRDTSAPAVRAQLDEALDAIDDGLSGDVVALRLAGAARAEGFDAPDPVALLTDRFGALVAGG
jgi:hypothetical protein